MLIRCKMHMTKSTQSRKPWSQQQQHRITFPQKKQIHGYSRLQIIWESFLSIPFPSEHNTWLNLNITFLGQLLLPKATCSKCIWMRQEEELKKKKKGCKNSFVDLENYQDFCRNLEKAKRSDMLFSIFCHLCTVTIEDGHVKHGKSFKSCGQHMCK